MKVTIKDVAREAQVATSTVSRVLANSRKISEETKERVNEAIKKLNNREKLVLDLRFYKGRTQIEVADEIGISQAQVSRIEKNALKNMRKYI